LGTRIGVEAGGGEQGGADVSVEERVAAAAVRRGYAERGSPKYEKAALRWLERYLTEGSPRLKHFAEITASLAKREPTDG
jgi:hypothetical protein